ncbi:MAG: hypothetical protein HYX24_00685 [Candidatus Aenigmarchaeota archaeon]|nr:hypothetical protein [Candidatus Aenigmarchaeota archaeon]
MLGQVSFTSRPILLVMTIVVLIFLLSSVWSGQTEQKKQKADLSLRSFAINILEILVSSEDCLALKADYDKSAYAFVISREQVESFARDYGSIEPPCAHNYRYGYRVTVTEFCKPYVDAWKRKTRTSVPEECEKPWEFGSKEFTPPELTKAYYSKVESSIPVGIFFGKQNIRVGRISISLVDGELERLAGAINEACFLSTKGIKEMSQDIDITAKASFDGRRVCIDFGTEMPCKQLLCSVESRELAKGSYRLKTKVGKDNIMRIES